MPAVRFPAVLLAAGTSVCIYWLTRKLFGSDRLALGAFLIGALVPMFFAGSALMTIDPILFFCWALASCLAIKAIFDEKQWAWAITGVIVGIGFLAKYAMYLWLPGLLIFLAIDSSSRKWLATIWPWVMIGNRAALARAPILIWNAQHQWVSFHHVASQTGTDATGALTRGNPLEFLASQFGILNPAIAILMIAAITHALRGQFKTDPNRRPMLFLLCIGLLIFIGCLIDSFRAKVQPNWPSPAYFTLLILTAYFHLHSCKIDSDVRRMAMVLLYCALVFGLAVPASLATSTILYPLVTWVNQKFPRKDSTTPRLTAKQIDFANKLRGIADPFAKTIDGYFKQLPPGSFILCEDYQNASLLAFYMDGQPKTYCVGSYWTDLAVRRRRTEFDIWPDRRLDRPELIGKDAIYVGTMAYAPLRDSFESVERLPDITIQKKGLDIRSFTVWRCLGFKGIHPPDNEGGY